MTPYVPWRAISGFRNIIVHDYLGVDLDMVWLVISTDLPALQAALRNVLRAADVLIAQAERVTLSERDSLRVLDLLENLPSPNARLMAAALALPTQT